MRREPVAKRKFPVGLTGAAERALRENNGEAPPSVTKRRRRSCGPGWKLSPS